MKKPVDSRGRRVGVGFVGASLALLLVGCRASLSDERSASGPGTPGAPGEEILPGVTSCEEGSLPPEAPELSRLVFPEYLATLRALFPTLTLDDVALPLDISLAGYIERASSHKPSSSLIADLDNSARKVSSKVLGAVGDVTGCSESDVDCLASYLEKLTVRAFRSEENDPSKAAISSFFRAQAATFGSTEALGMTLEVLLQSPEFVYKIERGVADPNSGRRVLSGRELAAKLSYLLWDAPPDAALLADADAGRLDEDEGLEQAIERMLSSDQARAAVASYFRQWLRGDKFFAQLEDKAPDAFPDYSPEVALSLEKGLEKFIASTFFEGTFSDFFGGTYAFVDSNSAPLYEVTGAGAELTRVSLDPTTRRGLLGQAGFLAGTSHKSLEAPIQRGVFVLERVLCSPPPPPPPGVNLELPSLDASQPRTLRQVIEDSHAVGGCKGCHGVIDGVGFTLNNYDAIGRYQTSQYGLPIDASGELIADTDIDGPIANAVELSSRLAESQQARLCLTKEFLAHALARSLTDADGCSLPNAAEKVTDREGKLRSMVFATTSSLAFRTRAPF